jgi:hypothetical protein
MFADYKNQVWMVVNLFLSNYIRLCFVWLKNKKMKKKSAVSEFVNETPRGGKTILIKIIKNK